MLHRFLKSAAFVAAGILFSGSVQATPVNGTGLVTPEVIFGSGNANGSFTGVNTGDVELGLRGKVRYNSGGLPENTFNYDGDRTYTFSPASSNAPSNRSAFNFEWSINTNSSGASSYFLDDLTYLLEIDLNPTSGTSFVSFDPVNQLYVDNALGDNSTGNGGGTVAPGAVAYALGIATQNVAQNSWNLGFFTPGWVDPQAEGLYTINLSAALNGNVIASTSIDIQYGITPVPVPAALPLLAGGIAALGFVGWRRRKTQA